MITGKANALYEWARTWPELGGYLKLGAILTEDGEACVNIVPNETTINRYIDGTADRRYSFQLKVILPWSAGYDETNRAAAELVSTWHDWVSAQYDLGNVPAWNGAHITSIKPSQNAPALNFVYQDDGLAEYVFEAEINYTE